MQQASEQQQHVLQLLDGILTHIMNTNPSPDSTAKKQFGRQYAKFL